MFRLFGRLLERLGCLVTIAAVSTLLLVIRADHDRFLWGLSSRTALAVWILLAVGLFLLWAGERLGRPTVRVQVVPDDERVRERDVLD